MKYELISLNYQYDALEPHLDAQTMEIHHTKHHQTYVDKLNEVLGKYPDLDEKLEDLLSGKVAPPDEIKTAVINFGGGVYNHNFFFSGLSPQKTTPVAEIVTLKDQFLEAATKVFGSGWCWVVKDAGELKIVTTQNQDTPLKNNQTPILAVDVWEHAYYLKFQNRRADYLKAWWEVINWAVVAQNLNL